jgi:hypothetical protein
MSIVRPGRRGSSFFDESTLMVSGFAELSALGDCAVAAVASAPQRTAHRNGNRSGKLREGNAEKMRRGAGETPEAGRMSSGASAKDLLFAGRASRSFAALRTTKG